MKCQQLLSFPIIIILLANLSLAFAVPHYHFGNAIVRDGITVHGIDGFWFSTSGTDATDIVWFENNWFNYSVSGVGIQQVYNGSKPKDVWVDGLNETEGVGWTYTAGVITVNGATSAVWIYWFEATTEPPIEPPVVETEGTTRYYSEEGGNIGFHYGEEDFILTVSTGVWNGSNAQYYLASDSGSVSFLAEEDTTILVTAPARFYVSGQGCTFTKLGEGSYSAVITNSNNVVISWSGTMAPLLPIMFMAGMLGLGMLIVGPIWVWHKIKDKEYMSGLISGVVLMSLGFGFFIGWLFS